MNTTTKTEIEEQCTHGGAGPGLPGSCKACVRRINAEKAAAWTAGHPGIVETIMFVREGARL